MATSVWGTAVRCPYGRAATEHNGQEGYQYHNQFYLSVINRLKSTISGERSNVSRKIDIYALASKEVKRFNTSCYFSLQTQPFHVLGGVGFSFKNKLI